MQFIGLILNQVVIPVATVFFILSGLVAAITSAGIEYSVFNSLFTSTNQTRIPTWLIAELIRCRSGILKNISSLSEWAYSIFIRYVF